MQYVTAEKIKENKSLFVPCVNDSIEEVFRLLIKATVSDLNLELVNYIGFACDGALVMTGVSNLVRI